MPSLHSLGHNQLKDEGTIIVCNALKDSKVSKLKELVLSGNGITATGAASVAAYLAISAELTSVRLMRLNEIQPTSQANVLFSCAHRLTSATIASTKLLRSSCSPR